MSPKPSILFYAAIKNNISNGIPYPEVEFLRRNGAPLAAVIAIKGGDLSWEDSATDRVHAQFVTANYFTELGAGAAWGRTLSAAMDESPSADPAVVLSYGFWQRRFGSDPSIVGTVIRLNKKTVTVAGVAPVDFTGLQPGNIDLWVPIHRQPYLVEGSKLLIDYESGVLLYGRLRPGMSPRATEDSLRPFVTTLREQHPKIFWDGEFLQAQPGAYLAHLEREALPVLVMGGALVLLVLVIACANLGNLQLARGLARASEMRIRSAVGAGRRRIVRQLLTESFLLAVLGSIAGLFLSFAVARGVLLALNAPQFLNPAFDWRVGLFVLTMACLATLFFGLTPALHATRPRGTGNRARLVLISGQIAASCILLVISSLLVRGIDRFLRISPGFEYRHVFSLDPALYEHGFTAAGATQYLRSTAERLRQLPGIDAVAWTTIPPLGNRGFNEGLDGFPGVQPCSNEVSSDYFQTLSIPILEGRAFREGDRDVVVVSESLARRLWPGQTAIGKRYPRASLLETVIGVAGNARTTALSDGQATEVYRPLSIAHAANAVFVVRSAEMPERVAGDVRKTAVAADPRTTPELTLLETAYAEKTQTSRRGAYVVSVLGAVALLLAAIGIFGVVAFSVTQRTREIGLRVALGARPGDVLSVVLRQFLIPAAVGLGSGIAGAAGLSMILRGQLYGLSNLDPLSYIAGLALFGVVAAVAALWPARRALRVQPSTALRYE